MSTTDKIMALADKYAFYVPGSAPGDAAREALRAEIEALVRDAERYRWLKDNCVAILEDDGKFSFPDLQGVSLVWRRRTWKDGKPVITCDGLDAGVDAAMQEKQS